VLRGVAVLSVDAGPAARLRLLLDKGSLEAEMAVVCAGAASVRLHGWLRDRIVPVQGQGLSLTRLTPPSGAEEFVPITANFGHVAARMVKDGPAAKLLCWNIPWSLRGSDPDGLRHEVLPDQQARIESYLSDRFTAARTFGGGGIGARWASHVGWTRDSLPIAGPAPGRPRLIYCTGFSGHEWGLGAFVAHVVADGIVGDRPPEGFEIFSPRRFLED
jgi:glycine/D-amino acid oxidase-like deaminating enzyme